jgi:hypothetical protein
MKKALHNATFWATNSLSEAVAVRALREAGGGCIRNNFAQIFVLDASG